VRNVSVLIGIINYKNRTKLTASYCIYWNHFHMFLYTI